MPSLIRGLVSPRFGVLPAGKLKDERLLTSSPGIGPRPPGLAAWARQSGQSRGKSIIISGGRSRVRATVDMAELVASRFDPGPGELYQRPLIL